MSTLDGSPRSGGRTLDGSGSGGGTLDGLPVPAGSAQFQGDGVIMEFVLPVSFPPGTEASLSVTQNGLESLLDSTPTTWDEYWIAGNVLRFGAAPPSTRKIEIKFKL